MENTVNTSEKTYKTITNGNITTSGVEFVSRGVRYAFAVSNDPFSFGKVSVYTKRLKYYGMGMISTISEAKFAEKYGVEILNEMKANLGSVGHHVTDNVANPNF